MSGIRVKVRSVRLTRVCATPAESDPQCVVTDVCLQRSPCQNGGSCTRLPHLGYSCSCSPAWTVGGTRCSDFCRHCAKIENNNAIINMMPKSPFPTQQTVVIDSSFKTLKRLRLCIHITP